MPVCGSSPVGASDGGGVAGILEAISKAAWVAAVHYGRMPFLVAWGRCHGNLCILLTPFESALFLSLSSCFVGFSLFIPGL